MSVNAVFHSLTQKYLAVICVLIAVLTGWIAGARVQTPPRMWPDHTSLAPTNPLSDAAFLLTIRQRALIWEPANPAVPFAYRSLDAPGDETGLLLYGTIQPQSWATVPAQADSFHLVWSDADNHLRSALVHTSGETLRGPVDLLARAPGSIRVVSAANGAARVFWRTEDNTITSLPLDSEGRPGQVTAHTPRYVQHFAVAADNDFGLYAAWLTAESPGTWQIMTQHLDSAAGSVPRLLHTFNLPHDASIASFELGLDRRYGYVILGTTRATQPDTEQVTVIAFPLTGTGETRITELALPAALRIEASPHPTPFITGPVALIQPQTAGVQAALRWPRPIAGQHAEFALALAVQRDRAWLPGVVYFANGVPYGYQIIAQTPADAGPPVLGAAPDGALYMSWVALDRTVPRRYTASTGNQGWIVPQPDRGDLMHRTAASLLTGSLLSLLTLIPLALAVMVIPTRTWTPAAFYALYAASKLIWPPDLFAHIPPLLAYDFLTPIDAAWRVGLAVGAIMLASMGVAAIVRTPTRAAWPRWLLFAALDTALTWIVFGPAFIG